MNEIHLLDLNFQGLPGAIAAYLLPHENGCALIECGPGASLPGLQAALRAHGYAAGDVSDVLLTHIHLDHAGAAGWLARQGARIHVHANGAAHLLDPEKLLASAARVFGEKMDTLWGEFLPVPPEQLHVTGDEDVIALGSRRVRALDTPGHAAHHLCYLTDGVCFTGDVGGVRMAGIRHVRLPAPPPEFHIETWRATLARLRSLPITRLAPTHFGFYEDVDWHWEAIARGLDAIERWLEAVFPANPSVETMHKLFDEFTRQTFYDDGYDQSFLPLLEVGSPTTMSADGIARYWKKFRQ